jgi:phosphate transport system substrate-binding protein
MYQPKNTSVVTLTILLVLAAVPKSSVLRSVADPLLSAPVLAQAAPQAFPLPTSVPEGTALKVDGSSSMKSINDALKQKFETQFPAAKINIAAEGTPNALKALQEGKIDLAAIGRPLTETETAAGLKAVPISRDKIAMVVGADNPFAGSLTIEQFAKIFRGEIKDWSEVGGSPGPIRFVDRPESSDTRQAFQSYPVFKAAPFQTGATAEQLTEDTTEAVIAKLGKDGISYAIADQVTNVAGAKVLQMHNTLPDNPKYPFSQPLAYVYKGPNAAPGVAAFLGFATASDNQRVIAAAQAERATASPSPEAPAAASPEASPSPVAAAEGSGFPWWLLLIPALGGLAWWLLRKRPEEGVAAVDAEPTVPRVPAAAPVATAAAGAVAAGAVAAKKAPASRIILVPRSCQEAYAYWEVPEANRVPVRQRGGRNLKLRLYDVTDIDLDYHEAHSMQQFDCTEQDADLHLQIANDDRDYLVELGYATADNQWLSLARSAHVRVPACEPDRTVIQSGGAAIAGGAAAATGATATAKEGLFNFVDDLKSSVGDRVDAAREKLGDLTDSAADTATSARGRLGDMTSGIGDIASSARDRLEDLTANTGGTAAAAFGGIAGAAAAARSFIPGLGSQDSSTGSGSRLILVPRSTTDAYAYWEVPDTDKAALRQRGGLNLLLRLYDVTQIDINTQSPHSMQQFECSELDADRHVPIPRSDRDYLAELGYTTSQGEWLPLARSATVRVAS